MNVVVAGYETQEYAIPVAGRILRLLGPRWPEAPHNDPARRDRYEHAGYSPYWTKPWPAAVMLAEYVLRNVPVGPDLILELGAGLGLAGLALTRAGYRVTLTDIDAEALEFVRASARRNGLAPHAIELQDWRRPAPRPYAIIIAATAVYDSAAVVPLAAFLATTLTPAGQAIFGNQDFSVAADFPGALHNAGLTCAIRPATAPAIPGCGSVDGRIFAGTICHIRRAGERC